MSNLKDRKNAEEAHFAQTAEIGFKRLAQNNRDIGTWIAGLIGLTSEPLGNEFAALIVSCSAANRDSATISLMTSYLGDRLSRAEIAQKLAEFRTRLEG